MSFLTVTILPYVQYFCIAITFCFGVLFFSSIWIYPCFLFGYIQYIPFWRTIRTDGHHDDYFYYARIKKIMDGYINISDPIVLEFQKRPHMHNMLQLSYIFGTIFSNKNKNIIYTFILNMTIYPFIHIFLMIIISFCFTQNLALSTCAAFLTIFGASYNQFHLRRFPHIMFTGIHALLLGLCSMLYFSPSFSPGVSICMVVIVGVSPIINPPNAAFAACLLPLLALMDAPHTVEQFGFFMGATMLAIPCALYALWHARSSRNLLHFAHFYPQQEAKQLRHAVKRYLFPICLTVPVALLCNMQHSKALLCILGASLATPCIFHLITRNAAMSWRALERGIGELPLLAAWSVAFNLAHLSLNRYLPTLTLLLVTIGLGYVTTKSYFWVRTELHNIRKNMHIYHNAELRELINYLQTLTNSDTVLTVDFSLALNLPAYVSAWFYIPQAIQSTAMENEIWERLREACLFLCVSVDEYQRFLTALCSPYTKADSFVYTQEADATLVLTYGRWSARFHEAQVLPDEEIERQVKAYEARLQGLPSKTNVTLLIISVEQPLRRNLYDRLRQSKIEPQFSNARYACYAITSELRDFLMRA